jgi:2-iminobutanoate/2-iminopropanoate deaminase
MDSRHARTIALVALVGLGSACREPATEHLDAPTAIGPYSAAVVADDFVFLAGKGGDVTKTFKEEVAGTIDSIEADLARVGLTLADVVSMNVYLTDMALFGEMNEVYAARFPAPYPARTTVGVASLPKKGMRVEMTAVARRR